MAIAQIAGQSQTQLKQLPAGTTPPLIITYKRFQRAHSSDGSLRTHAFRKQQFK